MARYGVTLPLTGSVYVEVEASSKKEAIERAFEVEIKDDDILEWQTHDIVAEGNVFHGVQNEAEANLLDE